MQLANQDSITNVPLNPPLTVTPAPGQPLTANVEVRGTLSGSGSESCGVFLLPTVNGNPMVIGELLSLQSPDSPPEPPFLNGIPISSASFPVGLGQPGVAQSIGMVISGDEDCTAGSRVDQVTVVVAQEK